MTNPALVLRQEFYQSALQRKVLALVALIAAADWLLFSHAPGLALVIFLVTLAGMVSFIGVPRVDAGLGLRAFAILGVCLLPLIEDVNPVSLCFAIAGICLFTSIILSPKNWSFENYLQAALRLGVSGPLQVFLDLNSHRVRRIGRAFPAFGKVSLAGWIVPAVAGCLFLSVFVQANPLIEMIIGAINFRSLLALFDLPRFAFWFVALLLLWPFMFFRPWRITSSATEKTTASSRIDGPIFGYQAILRSLILFNIIFGWQTLSDVAFLWGGAELPAGVTYAQYAQRGAYALIAAALLSGAFLLAAMQPGSRADGSRLVRLLVYVWTAQNILMMVSAAMRLYAYVDIYSLTIQRMWAFALIFLIGCGLSLILVRIGLRRSNYWLVMANAVLLAGVLYASAFVNAPRVIADFNIAHSRQVSGKGIYLDFGYLISLGPEAFPSINAFLEAQTAKISSHSAYDIRSITGLHMVRYFSVRDDWRSWTWRDARLLRRVQEAYGDAP